MRIAMLGVKSVPAIGGIARYVEEVGSRLVRRGHEVTVYCRPHYLEGEGDYRGMRRIVTRGLHGKHLDAFTHTLSATAHALTQGYDLVHIHGSAPGFMAPLARLRARQGVVLTIHGLDWQAAKWGRAASALMRFAGHLAADSADVRTAVSRSLRDAYCETFPGRVAVVPTGVDVLEPEPPEQIRSLGLLPGEYVFCASRLMPEKGVHYLVEAFESIPTDKKLVIAGNAPYDDDFTRSLLARASERVLFPGFVTGRLLAELFSNAWVYVQPSDLEGLSMAVLEALSYGRCVLASDIAPNLEALDGCGYTFRKADVEDLRAKLEWLLSEPDAVAAQFDRARRYIREKRSWDRTVDEYEELYEEALSGRAALAREQMSLESCPEPRRS